MKEERRSEGEEPMGSGGRQLREGSHRITRCDASAQRLAQNSACQPIGKLLTAREVSI